MTTRLDALAGLVERAAAMMEAAADHPGETPATAWRNEAADLRRALDAAIQREEGGEQAGRLSWEAFGRQALPLLEKTAECIRFADPPSALCQCEACGCVGNAPLALRQEEIRRLLLAAPTSRCENPPTPTPGVVSREEAIQDVAKRAWVSGYEQGHHDTVETGYYDPASQWDDDEQLRSDVLGAVPSEPMVTRARALRAALVAHAAGRDGADWSLVGRVAARALDEGGGDE